MKRPQTSEMIDEISKVSSKYTGTETQVIPNLLAAAVFFLPNLLMLFPNLRNQGIGYFLFYDYVIIFVLISGMSMFKFNRQRG